MKTIFLNLFLACFFLAQISCKCHGIDECSPDGGFIKFKLMKDGNDAIFGPNATINRDSIRFFNSADFGYDDFISYNDSTKTMDLFIENKQEYIFKIDNIRTDTIIGTTVVTSTDDCGCSSFKFLKVTMNGQVICQDGCDEIIEVQL